MVRRNRTEAPPSSALLLLLLTLLVLAMAMTASSSAPPGGGRSAVGSGRSSVSVPIAFAHALRVPTAFAARGGGGGGGGRSFAGRTSNLNLNANPHLINTHPRRPNFSPSPKPNYIPSSLGRAFLPPTSISGSISGSTPPLSLGMLRGGSDESGDTGSSSSKLRSSAAETEETVDADAEKAEEEAEAEARSETTKSKATSSSSSSSICSSSKILATDSEFLKPNPDTRSYRALALPNSLTVLLVSDPQTDVEAGSVHINSGHFHDPPNRAGLAHFHEHMLFLGTAKYGGEDDWEGYLGRNGGSSNAYTDMEDTNYYFSVAPLDHDEGEDDDNEDTMEVGEVGEDGDNGEEGKAAAEGTSPSLAGALDRLSQFFISPNFAPEMVERELRAVDSEYTNSLSADSWRNYQLLKSYANAGHPFGKFGCGTYSTLTDGGDIGHESGSASESGGSNPRADLVKFWEDNYQTPNMRLCVVGRAGLDELQRSVEETFGNIRAPSEEWLEGFGRFKDGSRAAAEAAAEAASAANGEGKVEETHQDGSSEEKIFKSEHKTYAIPAFSPNTNLGLIREVIPVVESRIIKLQFGTPPLDDPKLVDARPYRVLSHLLGHESPGSLHSLLNDEGLINSLSSGVGIDTEDFSLCSLTVSLTPEGMAQRDRVLSLIWQWTSLIRSSVNGGSDEDEDRGLMAKYHDEMRAVSDVNFKFRENGDPTDFCSAAAGLLFQYEPAELLAGSSLTGEYDAEVTKAFLDRFTPENCLVTVWDPDLDKDEDEEGQDEEGKGKAEDTIQCSASAAEWKKEKWYGAKHRQVRTPETLTREWSDPPTIDPRLKLPDLNEFIPTDFTLRCDDGVDDPQPLAEDDPYRTQPPTVLIQRPDLRLWHKMDRTFRVPKTHVRVELTSPVPYRSPRSMTLNRLYQKVLRDDLNEFVYDASVAGCNYNVICVPLGYRVAVSGYSEKLPHLLDVVTSRMLSLIEEMKKGPDASPSLAQKFEKARQNLARQTKNFRLESPYETCSYVTRMLIEDNVWHVDDYVDEMEGQYADTHPLTMEECAKVAEESLLGRGKAEAICMGNINEEEARKVGDVILNHFLQSRPLHDDEVPIFRSLKLPTRDEAARIYGPEVASMPIPIKIEQVAYSESEENNAYEMMIQTGSDHDLSWEGVATQELLSYIAYNSAYNQLRTKEQLGYIVSAFTRKTAGGGNSLAVVVQSSTALPAILEERCEAWLQTFRKELEEMTEEIIAMEAAAVVAQLLERDMKLGDEINSAWGEILATETLSEKVKEPVFDRVERFAKYLTVGDEGSNPQESGADGEPSTKLTAAQLKKQMIEFFDTHLSASSPSRRAVSARVYAQKNKEEFEKNVGKPGILSSYADSRHLKQFLSSYPTAPYWINK